MLFKLNHRSYFSPLSTGLQDVLCADSNQSILLTFYVLRLSWEALCQESC
jgi:hypothetical protein